MTAHTFFGYFFHMKISNLLSLFGALTLIMLSTPTRAAIVQILHTNDNHSYLDNSTHSTIRGGAARLKTLIDQYKNMMKDQGVKTFVVDAGDFLEGNLYFMAQNGRKSFEVHNEMGYDFGTLGNHDYQMGTDELNKILGEFDLKFSILVANLNPALKYGNLKDKISPYKEVDVDGVKIAFLGLTTDELLYKWRLLPGAILDPIETAQTYDTILKTRKNDFIIALTHIGVFKDIKLAEKTFNIDLVVGGHSHTTLFTPVFAENKAGRKIPIVQAGQHTEFLGRIVLDLQKGKPLKILSYELIPVVVEAAASTNNIKEIVKSADAELDAFYGKDWLNQKLGHSDLKPNDESGMRKWAYYITDSMREKAGADIGIHVPEMNGENFPIGEITRKDILNSIPRVFDLDQKFGWDIYTTKVKGAWLRLTIDALARVGEPLTMSGIKLEYERGPLGFKIKNITVNGKNVNPFKTYTVAFTEGIVRGAKGIDPRTLAILQNPYNTGFKIWATLEDRIVAKPESLARINEENHTIIWPTKE
ncbi:MAG: bifunctional metallophosphatase/5'-nucleotidase [Bdellovibrionales bacterium]|nr:bifunctional metallophosphatase/5'-nucleotidase [Bdellovibrionales bacterium]